MTIADTVFDTINDNWGSGGYAGDTPAIDSMETQTAHDEVTANVIEVRHYTLREAGDQRNDKYVDRHYSLDVYVSTKTSSAQLKLLYDEVEYLLRNTAMTGLQLERIDKDFNVSQWEQGRHSVVLRVAVVALLSDGAVTSATGTTGTFTAGHLVATIDTTTPLLTVTGAATVGSVVTAGNVDGVDVSTLSTLAGATVTAAQLEDLLMFGSANAAWVPTCLLGPNNVGKLTYQAGWLDNLDATDLWVGFILPLPTTKGSLKLYVTGVRVVVFDADADDYVDAVTLYGVNETGMTTITPTDSGTNRTAQGDYEYALADTDCSSYDMVMVTVITVCTNAQDLDFAPPLLQCFYDT